MKRILRDFDVMNNENRAKNRDQNFEVTMPVDLDEADDAGNLLQKAKKLLRARDVPPLEIKRRSIDARRGKVNFVYTLGPIDEEREARLKKTLREVSGEPVIIIGGGPAGLFCAYELARRGINAIICERGKPVQERRRDLKGLNQHGIVDEDSNYCFGEGGAGTYSDGKLYTRSHKRGSVRDILEILVTHGAKPSILTDARPHIGSNQLPKVIAALRASLEQVGVTFLFGAKVVDIMVEDGRVQGVLLQNGQQIAGKKIVLATGHGARDIFHLMSKLGVKLEAKPFAMGVRIEHPQSLINHLQYGKYAGHQKLPPAAYRLAYTPSDGRGAFSFCMCPGGWIVPASTQKHGLVVNGMSLSKRDSAFANSGLVASVFVDDVVRLGFVGPLGGIILQEHFEALAKEAGGTGLVAPAVRAQDFLDDKISSGLPPTSYLPGIIPADFKDLFLKAGLTSLHHRLKEALHYFNHVMPGYVSDDAVLVGVESRTSSPVRIVRDENTLCSNIGGLFPCGEGAGYAGGIMSAAMDGIKIAQHVSGSMQN